MRPSLFWALSLACGMAGCAHTSPPPLPAMTEEELDIYEAVARQRVANAQVAVLCFGYGTREQVEDVQEMPDGFWTRLQHEPRAKRKRDCKRRYLQTTMPSGGDSVIMERTLGQIAAWVYLGQIERLPGGSAQLRVGYTSTMKDEAWVVRCEKDASHPGAWSVVYVNRYLEY